MNSLNPRSTTPTGWLIERQAATEHPVRCPARLSLFAFAAADGSQRHTHECIHPARRPEGVTGVLEHQCHCGATWTERNSAGETKTSNEEDRDA